MNKVAERLFELQEAVNNEESLSYDDVIFLQNHKAEIKGLGDIELAQWAGISEEEWNNILAY